jgi:hypothetical protein
MGDINRSPFVLVETTYTVALAGGVVQKNIRAADLPASQLNKIPPRLRNTLRGTIEFISLVNATPTGSGTQTEVMFFGNDSFLAAGAASRVEYLGLQQLVGAAWDASSSTYVIADAENVGIFYRDKDNTGEFHVRIETGAVGPPDQAGLLRFIWRPEISVP